MHKLARTVMGVLAMTLVGSIAAAQQHGNVVYVSPKHGTGLSILGDYARGLNDASFKTNYFGGRVILGLPILTASAGVGMVNTDDALDPGGEGEITFGGNVAVNVISAPFLPVAVSLHAGVGYLKEGSGGAGDQTTIQVPLGAALAIRVPSPGVSVEPWVAPRIHISRTSGGGVSATDTNFGASGGVNVGLPNGIGIHVAFDYLSETGASPLVVGVGLHYKISVPGLGMM